MLLRICLVLAIVAGIGVIAVGHFQVRPHIQGIMDVRDQNEREWKKWEGNAKRLEKDLKSTKATLEKTENELTQTKSARDAALAKVAEEQRRGADLQNRLTKTAQDLNATQQELSRWTLLGLTIEQIKDLQVAEKNLRAANEALKAENVVLGGKLKTLQTRIDDMVKGEQEQPLPIGTKGRILVVDPKWNFVVLDIGEKEQIVRNGVLTVHRGGKLVGKIKVVSVQGARSIANVMPGWNLGEMMEGDSVFY